MTKLRGAVRRLPPLVGAAALAAWPLLFDSPYSLRLLAIAGCYALATLGYQFIFGRAGALSLAQGTFFGLGAYTTGILGVSFGWGFAATFPLSVLLPVLLAALVAVPVLRLESHYFALATLGLGQVTFLAAIHWQEVTGGANGLPGVPGIVLFGEAPLPRGLPTLAAVWGCVALGALLASRLAGGLRGLALTALRENPMAAATIGLDAGRLRFAAFLLSAGYGGAGGALYAHALRVVSPEALGFSITVACLAMTVVGGRDRVAGALLGALLLVHLPEWFRGLDLYRNVAYGAALLAAIVLAPSGIAGAVERWRERLLPAPRPAPPLPRPLPPQTAGGGGGTSMLEVKGLRKSFGGVAAVQGVDLTVRRGEIVGLIGPNGSGKTTLVNLVTGLERADAGRVRFADADIAGLPAHAIARRGVARTFQAPSLVEELTALDNVALARGAAEGRVGFAAALLRAPLRRDLVFATARGEAMALLAAVGAAAEAARPAGALPHGLRRRIEIARALALRPSLLLLDEPAAGLAEEERADLARRLDELATGGVALLVVEHNMPFLLPLAHRVVCLDQGRIIAAGPPEAVRNDPLVIEAYLGRPAAETAA